MLEVLAKIRVVFKNNLYCLDLDEKFTILWILLATDLRNKKNHFVSSELLKTDDSNKT